MQTGKTTEAPLNWVVRYLNGTAVRPSVEKLTDRELIERFAAGHDEAAFAALLSRHGPMVLGLCRRLLNHTQDAEDVFQATFLLLAKKAATIRKREAVGSWLYGVARRLGLRARARAAGRRKRETQGSAQPQPDPAAEMTWREVQAALDQELAGLPDRYRAPLILCYLEGLTQESAALRLGWSKGTLRRRLDAGVALLRDRFRQRGLSAPVGLLALAAGAGTVLPAALARDLPHAAHQLATGQAAAGSARVAALVEEGLTLMALSNAKLTTIVLVALGFLATGLGALAYPGPERPAIADPFAAAAPAEQPVKPVREPAKAPTPGEGLPAGALRRFGNWDLWHGGGANRVVFSPDGKLLACVQINGTVHMIQFPSGKVAYRVEGDKVEVAVPAQATYVAPDLVFSPDGKYFAVNRQGSVAIRDVDKGKEVSRVGTDLQNERAMAFSPDGKLLATGGVRKPVRLWDVASAKEVKALEGSKSRVAAVAFSPDGKLLATGGDDQVVRLWNVEKGEVVCTLPGHRNTVLGIVFAPDGKTLASVAMDDTIRVWEAASGELRRRIDKTRVIDTVAGWGAEGGFAFVAFGPDGKSLALGRTDRTIRLWDTATGKEQPRFEGQSGIYAYPAQLALSPDGKSVAQGNVAGRIRFWDRTTADEIVPESGVHYPIEAVALSPDGKVLATGGTDRVIHLWDAATGKELKQLQGHSGSVACLAFSPDGKELASASTDHADRTLSFWDPTTGKEIGQLKLNEVMKDANPRVPGQPPGVFSLAYVEGGNTLALLGRDGAVWLADRAGKKDARSLKQVRGSGIAVSPDGKTLAVAVFDGTVKLYDAAKGEETANLTGTGRQIAYSMAFRADGQSLVTHCSDNSLHLWDLTTGKAVRTLVEPSREGFGARIPLDGMPTPRYTGRNSVACSPDGRTVAYVGPDLSVRVVEVASSKERSRFTGHQWDVSSLAYSPDGRRLVTGSLDSTVLVWDVVGTGSAKSDKPLTADGVKALWTDLEGRDAAKAFAAIRALAADPTVALPFLKDNLKPAEGASTDQIAKYVKDLDSDQFPVRKAAADGLQKIGEPAREALRKVLDSKPGLDLAQRVEDLLKTIDTQGIPAEQLRALRAIEALEYAATPEAKALLKKLSEGAAEQRPTREARAALARLQ